MESDMKIGTYENIAGETIKFNYKEKLSYSELVYLIGKIADDCFTENGDYLPYFYDYLLMQSIILGFTDIELPDDVDERYAFIYDNKINELFELYTSDEDKISIDHRQIDFISDNSHELVEYRKENLLKQSKVDDLLDELNNELTSFIKKMSKKFEGLNLEDLKGFSKLAEEFGDIDQDKFMDKIIDFAKKEE